MVKLNVLLPLHWQFKEISVNFNQIESQISYVYVKYKLNFSSRPCWTPNSLLLCEGYYYSYNFIPFQTNFLELSKHSFLMGTEKSWFELKLWTYLKYCSKLNLATISYFVLYLFIFILFLQLVDVAEMEYYSSNQQGEICIKGTCIFQGYVIDCTLCTTNTYWRNFIHSYFKDPERTAATIDQNGMFRNRSWRW